jgi:hypothetical protein
MRLSAFVLAGVLFCAHLCAGIIDISEIIKRGDSNHSGVVNMSDVVYLNSYLFNGGPAPQCMNEADAQHDGRVDVSDPIYLLNWLYSGGPAPPAPGPFNTSCTTSSAPVISCNVGC